MIIFLHTAPVHVARFEALVRQYDQHIITKHMVNEKLLETAVTTGHVDKQGFEQAIRKIKTLNPKFIICTCSTYGTLCEQKANVHRIDQPVAEYLVKNFKHIGLAYTAASTRTASEQLLQDLAKQYKKEVAIVSCDCTQHWPLFKNGDLVGYEKGIANNIQAIQSQVDVVFLAQASMEGANRYLHNSIGFSKPVFSSPDFGVRALLKLILKR